MPWSTSTRASRLPNNWQAIRRQVKARAHGLCEYEHHVRSCDGIGTDADHIKAGDNHGLDNLQWLSGPCHDHKTAREAATRNRNLARLKQRPKEQHPGRRT